MHACSVSWDGMEWDGLRGREGRLAGWLAGCCHSATPSGPYIHTHTASLILCVMYVIDHVMSVVGWLRVLIYQM